MFQMLELNAPELYDHEHNILFSLPDLCSHLLYFYISYFLYSFSFVFILFSFGFFKVTFVSLSPPVPCFIIFDAYNMWDPKYCRFLWDTAFAETLHIWTYSTWTARRPPGENIICQKVCKKSHALMPYRYCPARWIWPKLGSFDRSLLKEVLWRLFRKIRPPHPPRAL